MTERSAARTASEATRKNATVILRNVRGKSLEERRAYCAWLGFGPIGIGLLAFATVSLPAMQAIAATSPESEHG